MNSFLDPILDKLANAIQERKNPEGLIQRCLKFLRGFLIATNIAYTLLCFLFVGSVQYIGERHWFTAFCLYVPPQAWLFPLVLLTPLTAIFCRRWLFLHLACILATVFFFYDFHWNSPSQTQGKKLIRIMTNNYGQNNRQSISSFLEETNPDVVALQEIVGGRAIQFSKTYTNYQAVGVNQFILLSKYKISNYGLLPLRDHNSLPVVAWFELDFQGQPIIVYSVHLPSPRQELVRNFALSVVAAVAGLGPEEGRLGRFRQDNLTAWKRRMELASKLADHFKREERPFIVVGDFNMPPQGYLHRLFSRDLRDAFVSCGRGYGLTFPGYSSNPLTLFRPWLRLDYLFAGKGFKPVECRTEEDRKSQHRSVVAGFEMEK